MKKSSCPSPPPAISHPQQFPYTQLFQHMGKVKVWIILSVGGEGGASGRNEKRESNYINRNLPS